MAMDRGKRAANRTDWLGWTVLVVAFLLSSVVPASAYSTAVLGDQIGDAYQERCAGDTLVGFRLNQGSAIDQLTPLCAALHAGRVVDNDVTMLESIGGSGGDEVTIRCPANSSVTKIGVYQDKPGSGGGINDISIVCLNLQKGSVKEVETGWEPSGFSRPYTYLACGRDQLGGGVMGHAGNIIFAIGLSCDKNPFVQTDAPQPATPSGSGGFTAFAIGSDGYWGYNNNPEDEASARQHAVSGCGGSAHNCKDFWATTDSCVAFAMSPAPDYYYAAGSGTSQNAAKSSAIKFCQSGNAPAGSCEVLMSRCH
jgi:hypothetical protein